MGNLLKEKCIDEYKVVLSIRQLVRNEILHKFDVSIEKKLSINPNDSDFHDWLEEERVRLKKLLSELAVNEEIRLAIRWASRS